MYYYIFGGIVLFFTIWTVGSYLAVRNLEEPNYVVLKKLNGYELREYQPYIIAETEVTGTYSKALNQGFSAIAGYIFGDNTSKTSIAMTAPVLQNESSEKIAMTVPVVNTLGNETTRTVSFVLPSKYTLETLPLPNNPKVILKEVPARKVAVLQFNWYATEKRILVKKEALEILIAEDGLAIDGPTQVAQYNPPFSMPLIRRNEIIIPITEPIQ